MKIIQLIQGTPEWHAHRAHHLNASDAPAMMGYSPYKTRAQLVREVATGIVPEVDAATEERFKDGHRYEALARPLAEQIVGEDLFPVTGTEGKYSASFDGLTLLEDTAFEHKSLNDQLREVMIDGCTGADLPLPYRIQMEHQVLVSGADRVLFMASKWNANDELVEERHCWYAPDLQLRAQLVSGWEQFEADVAAYEAPAAPAPAAPVGRAPETLPALSIQVTGMVTASNLAEFKASAMAVLGGINRDLRTDDDFANAEQTVRWCKGVEDRLESTKQQVLGQTADIEAVFRTMDEVSAETRKLRLELDKLVASEKEKRKAEIVEAGRKAVLAHYDTINATMGAHALAPPLRELTADFGAGIKGKRSLASMQDAVDTLAAQHKVAASQIAERVRACIQVMDADASQHGTLFPDRVALCAEKSPEDLRNLIAARIAEHQQQLAQQAAAAAVVVEVPAPVAAEEPKPAQAPRPTAVANEPIRYTKLGDINAAIAPLSISADGLAQLGFRPASTERGAKLYNAAQLPAMCEAMKGVLISAPGRAADKAAA